MAHLMMIEQLWVVHRSLCANTTCELEHKVYLCHLFECGEPCVSLEELHI